MVFHKLPMSLDMFTLSRDAILGFVLFGCFSVVTQLLHSHPAYMSIAGFWWAAPISFLYLLYITKSYGRLALTKFSRSAAVALLLTFLTAVFLGPVQHFLEKRAGIDPNLILYGAVLISIMIMLLQAWFVLTRP